MFHLMGYKQGNEHAYIYVYTITYRESLRFYQRLGGTLTLERYGLDLWFSGVGVEFGVT